MMDLQPASLATWASKYQLKDQDGKAVDQTPEETLARVAKALASVEKSRARKRWEHEFLDAMHAGAYPAGRILSNAGAGEHKPSASLINCTMSDTIHDSMAGIMRCLSEAAMTLKAGCVAPGTWVVTERGLVTADEAVMEKHEQILSYDPICGRFEMRAILRHLTTRVPQADNIELVAGGVSLKTSVQHPVLVYRDGGLVWARAGEVLGTDALVQRRFAWSADPEAALQAWFVGAHLGDGSAYERAIEYAPSRRKWAARAAAAGRMLVFKISTSRREVVERYAAFFARFAGSAARVVQTATVNGVPMWDYAVSSFAASRAEDLIDQQVGKKSEHLRIPMWIARNPDKYFLPFLAGLVDTDGHVSTEHGAVSIKMKNPRFAEELKALLGLFGVHAGLTATRSREHSYRGHVIRDTGSTVLKISDSDFLVEVARFMVDGGKRDRIVDCATRAGQYDRYAMSSDLREALVALMPTIGHEERQELGFYYGHHTAASVSRVWLDKWAARFSALSEAIAFVRTLRPIEAINRALTLPETFFDFTVEGHNNYLAGNSGLVVIHNCGIGYDFSTLRPKGAAVRGAGAKTSGPLPFMDVYDAMCATVSSAGGRRGAQMATMAVDHPDIERFIGAKREAGRLRHFNLSVLMTDEFLQLVDEGDDLLLRFGGTVYSVVGAQQLYDLIMRSTYEYAEPGVLFVDRINEMNNLWFCEDIRATNPCGEVPLPPYGCCLLGSLDLRGFVMDPFSAKARFDLLRFKQVVEVFTRMLDNVVELANLPLEQQTRELNRKRRHGMGYFGLGSALAMLGLEYGSPEAVQFTELVTMEMALTGWRAGVELAREKGPAPIMEEVFDVTPVMRVTRGMGSIDRLSGKVLLADYSRYMARIGEADPELLRDIATHGARFTHHTAIAPTGSLALSFGNNASNGIEPSFEHCYYRNIIVEGKATKERVEVRSAEALAFKERFGEWPPEGKFVSANDISPEQHIDMQAAAQRWVDASISKTINVPTSYPLEDFKQLYRYAYAQGLKGCATFRYNPEHHQGVLVKKDDAGKTVYRFTLADGSTVDARGDETLRYDGAEHVAANLYEAIKEGNYGRL